MGCLQKLSSADKDKVLKYLKENEYETTLIIGNLQQCGIDNDKSKRRCGDYYGYIENERLMGIIAFYNLGNCIAHFKSPEAVPLFSDIIKESNIDNLIGVDKYIIPLYERIKVSKNTKALSIYSYLVNKNFTAFMPKDAVVVNCDSVNREAAVDFIIETNNIGFGKICTKEEALKSIRERGAEEDQVFVIKDSRIVASALINGATDRICQIGGVYTSAEYRGNGYCKAAVSELCRRIKKRGKIPSLMVREDNIPALMAYTAVGFRHYQDNIIISFNNEKR